MIAVPSLSPSESAQSLVSRYFRSGLRLGVTSHELAMAGFGIFVWAVRGSDFVKEGGLNEGCLHRFCIQTWVRQCRLIESNASRFTIKIK